MKNDRNSDTSQKISDYEELAKQRLASQLAAERLRQMNKEKVLDPFEAWSEARDEILNTLESVHLRRAV